MEGSRSGLVVRRQHGRGRRRGGLGHLVERALVPSTCGRGGEELLELGLFLLLLGLELRDFFFVVRASS